MSIVLTRPMPEDLELAKHYRAAARLGLNLSAAKADEVLPVFHRCAVLRRHART
jgi:hypothetical protein